MLSLSGCSSVEKYSGKTQVYNSYSLCFDNYYSVDLTIIANREINNFEEYAWEIITHCLTNDFDGFIFSYDKNGYPNDLKVSVYLTQNDVKKNNPLFIMSYQSDDIDCNIKDNPEKYILKIE